MPLPDTSAASPPPAQWRQDGARRPGPRLAYAPASESRAEPDDTTRRVASPVPHGDRVHCRELKSLFRDSAFQRHFKPNSTVALHGEPADAVYQVLSGTVRCCTVDEDGCRQIFSFSKKGGFIGLSDLDVWHFTAEAVDHVVVKAVSRAVLERRLKENAVLRREVRAYVGNLLERRERQLLALVKKRAPERLRAFLDEFAASRPGAGNRPVALTMCRRDIADHLGMSLETVSRAFTELKARRQIEMVTPEKYRMTPRIANSISRAIA